MTIHGKLITCKVCKFKFGFSNNKDRNNWRTNLKLQCPQCKEYYCILDDTERSLRALQDLYFENNRDEIYINKMYPVLYSYTKSILLKKFRRVLKFLAVPTIREYIEVGVSLVVEKYYSKPDFYIKHSFGSYIELKLREICYGKKHNYYPDKTIDYEFEDGNFITYQETKNDIVKEIEEKEKIKNLIQKYCDSLFRIEEKCLTKKENYIRLSAFLIFLEKGDNASNKFIDMYGRIYREIFENTIDCFKKILKDELKNTLIYKNDKNAEILFKEW